MALTRKYLQGMGLTEEQVGAIIESNEETIKGLKAEIEKYKNDAEELPKIKAELTKIKEAAENGEKDPYKVKYEALKEEFASYKKTIAEKEIKTKKEEAYKQLLKSAGVSEKRIEAVLKVSDVDMLEFDDEGKVKDSDKLTENIKSEWADFIQTSSTEGAKVANPPSQTTNKQEDLGKLSMADYIKARNEMK